MSMESPISEKIADFITRQSMEKPMNERIAVLENEVRLMRIDQERVLEKLETIITKLTDDIRTLEADRHLRKGERGIIAIICTVFGSALGFFLNWLGSQR